MISFTLKLDHIANTRQKVQAVLMLNGSMVRPVFILSMAGTSG